MGLDVYVGPWIRYYRARNGSFKWSARFGLSALMPLLDWAVERRQPIIVDF
jgi:hypothetical protein